MTTIGMSRSNDAGRSESRGWIGFVIVGLIVALVGAVASADLVLATVAATLALGVMMIVGALLQLAHAFMVRRWSGTLLWTLSGLLYLVAGISVLVDPLFAAMLLTLFLTISLGLAGLVRCMLAWGWTAPGKGWLLVSGLVSLAAAVAVGLGWPMNSAWVLGLVLAIDLLVQGFALMLTGFSMKAA